MPLNHNAELLDLLSWHGHDRGGVRVPFGEFGDPLGEVIETPLVIRLRETAQHIAAGEPSPRWLLLLGGPGNGKSQMVEEFVRELDSAIGSGGALVDLVATSFAGAPIPRKVEIAELPGEVANRFSTQIGKLVIVQDASASDSAVVDAAGQLSEDLRDLLEGPLDPPPVFICCVNRGLLARAMIASREAIPVFDLLDAVVGAGGVGEAALQQSRPTCWPLDLSKVPTVPPEIGGLVGCWPLDVESLLLDYQTTETPADRILSVASSPDRWEKSGCDGCSSQPRCPLFQNAAWLRMPQQRRALLGILRRLELATGQRWNFRSLFSLSAEILVGEWEDFGSPHRAHPCAWVHERVATADSTDPDDSVRAVLELVLRLYPNALAPGGLPRPSPEVSNLEAQAPTTSAVARTVVTHEVHLGTAIRRRLRNHVARLVDPAAFSPRDEGNLLSLLEDGYAQSVRLGNAEWPAQAPPAQAEVLLLDLLASAEDECDPLLSGRESAKALAAVRFLRQLASHLAKRSVGFRLGLHGNQESLAGYEAVIRDPELLGSLRTLLRDLLSGTRFRFNALSSFGQPQADDGTLVVLNSNPMPIGGIREAPVASEQYPAHDLPSVSIAGRPIALTYELYSALQLRREKCAPGSLPASVRASLDRIRQVHAGLICRDEQEFLQNGAHIEIGVSGEVVVVTEGGQPRFQVKRGS